MPIITNPSMYPVKHVRVDADADGDNAIITAVTGKRIRVLAFAVTVGGTGGLIAFQDTAGTPVIHAEFSLAANGGVSYAGGIYAPAFETAAGTGLEINNPNGVDTVGFVTYQEV